MNEENVILGDVGEEAPPGLPQQCVSQAVGASLWDTDFFGPTEDEELWKKAVEGTKSVLNHLFENRWQYAYVFQDGETDHFFYKSYNGKTALPTVSPKEAWKQIVEGYNLPTDRPMAKFQLVRRDGGDPEQVRTPFMTLAKFGHGRRNERP